MTSRVIYGKTIEIQADSISLNAPISIPADLTVENINADNITASGNITAGSITSTGNIGGASITSSGNITAIGDVVGANVYSFNIVQGKEIKTTNPPLGLPPLDFLSASGRSQFLCPAGSGLSPVAAGSIIWDVTMTIKNSDQSVYGFIHGISPTQFVAIGGNLAFIPLTNWITAPALCPPFPTAIPVSGYIQNGVTKTTTIFQFELQPNGDVHIYKDPARNGYVAGDECHLEGNSAYIYLK